VTDITDSRRLELIAAAQEQWIAALTDLGGRNTLLYYKDRRAGTLDLAAADPDALDKFLATGSIRLTRLFKDADVRADFQPRDNTPAPSTTASYDSTSALPLRGRQHRMTAWPSRFRQPGCDIEFVRTNTLSHRVRRVGGHCGH
jgi:hypothetical protein